MEIKLAVLADAANVSKEGKLNITGIFDNLNAGQLPAKYPLVVVLRLHAHQSEAGSHELSVRVADADGDQMFSIEGPLELEKPRGKGGEPIKAQIILGLQDLTLPKAGAYSFDILVDGRYYESIPLTVTYPS